MSSGLGRYANSFSRGDQKGQYQAWNELVRQVEAIQVVVGTSDVQHVDSPASNPLAVPPPPSAAFNVIGLDGKYIVFVNNPQTIQPMSVALALAQLRAGFNAQNSSIVHNLQSATDLNFNQSSSLKDYGTSSQLLWTDQDPNVTRFFRLRSSLDGKTWNPWQFFSSAAQCGPAGVWSGLLRTAALTQVNAAYTPTTQPLTATTGVAVNQATISVAAFQVKYPSSISPATNNLVSYNSGAITPLLDATLYYVYCLDQIYAGGAQTYFATTDNPSVTGNEATVFLGTITTPVHGGGGTGGGGGGSGPCFSGNTLILVERNGVVRAAPISHLEVGDQVLTLVGWRPIRRVIEHRDYSGLMYRMPDCAVTESLSTRHEFVTPNHHIWARRTWKPADEVFANSAVELAEGKTVFNLEVAGDGSDETQCYTLANGWVAHNARKT